MANTYTQIFIHYVFVVQGRQNIIRSNFKEELYKFITGIVSNKNNKLITIGGMPDHIHLFVSQNPDTSVSYLARDIKANSSRFINEKKFVIGKFQWQKGFGAFSYSKSQMSKVYNYIQNQENHHKKKTFKEEYLELLSKFDIRYDEKYLFEFYDDNT